MAPIGELVAYAQLYLANLGTTLQTPNLLVKLSQEEIQEASSRTLTLEIGAELSQIMVFMFSMRRSGFARYLENLHWNLSTTRTPSALDSISTGNLVRAANELSSSLYSIPIKWAQLSQLPYQYFVGYPTHSSGLADSTQRSQLLRSGNGRCCAESRSAFDDIRRFDHAVRHARILKT